MIWVKKDIGIKEPGRLKCAGWTRRFLKPTCPMASDSTQQMSNPVKGCKNIKGTFSISIQG